MRFAVIGPLEVRTDDAALLAVPGAKERQLLAVLISSAPEAIGVRQLLDALWEEGPPPTARKSLQAHLVRLRTALEPGRPKGSSGRYIVRRGAGYALAVARPDVDALLVDDLAARGRALLASGDAEGALRQLDAAEELWRGTPYADWPDALFAEAERRRLAEVRTRLSSSLIEARLDLGRHADVVAELRALVASDPLRERWWSLLMLAFYRCGRQADALATARQARAMLAAELGAEPGPELRRMEAAILAQDPALDYSPPSPPPEPTGPAHANVICPYKGLAAYDSDDEPLFHGRSRLVTGLVARLVDAPLLVVSGPSGAGKSSVVRAGLVPALARNALPGSSAWRAVVVTPGRQPVDALADLTGEAPPTDPVLLVCDQLEELWAPGVEPAERQAFLDAVLGLLDDGIAARCIAVVRGDHVGRLAEDAAFAARANGALVLVPPPTERELIEMVCGPADSVGLTVEPELVAAVAGDALASLNALPLLSTALVGTWERRRGDVLTLAGYLQAGGVAGALTRSAEAAWAALPDDAKGAARPLLVRLADVDDGGAVVRRRLSLQEAGLHDPARREVVERFVERRLLAIDRGRLEVTHEALLTAWPRLSRWLDDDAAGRAVRRHLAPVALEWDRAGRPGDELYRGVRLAAALDWAGPSGTGLTAVERAFLAASQERAGAELGEARRRADEQTQARYRTRRLAVGLAGALVLALIAAGLAAGYQRRADDRATDALRATRVADANRLAALSTTAGSLDLSLLLAAQAVRLSDTPETEDGLLAALVAHPRVVRAVPVPGRPVGGGLSRDGKVLFLSTGDQLVTWQPATAPLPRVAFDIPDRWQFWRGADLSAAGVLAAAGWQNDTPWVSLVEAEGHERVLLTGSALGGYPLALAYGLDGRHLLVLVAQNGPDDVSRWHLTEVDLTDGAARPTAVTGTFASSAGPVGASFTADAATAVVWSGDAATLVPLDGRPPVAVHREARSSQSLALQAFGGGVLERWGDGTVTVYDRNGAVVQDLDAHRAPVNEVATAPDGTWAVTAGDGGAVFVWDIDAAGRWTQRERLTGQDGDVVAAKIDPTGRLLHTVSSDSTVVTRDMTQDGGFGSRFPGLPDRWISNRPQAVGPDLAVAPTRPVSKLAGPAGSPQPDTLAVAATFLDPGTGGVVDQVVVGDTFPGPLFGSSVSVSPDRSRVAVTSGLAMTVLDTRTRAILSRVVLPPVGDRAEDGTLQPAEAVWCAGWTADGSRLLLGAAGVVASRTGGGLVVVDPATAKVERRIDVGGAPQSIETSPDGHLLAVARADRPTVVVLDAATLATRATVPLGGGDYPYDLSFSPDGKRLAVGGEHGLLHIVDTGTWQPSQPAAKVSGGRLLQVEWLPDGSTVAAAAMDGAVALYDTSRQQLRGRPLPASSIAGGGYTHLLLGSSEIVTLSGERDGRRYPLDPARWLASACAVAGRDLAEAEWSRYLPTRSYQRTCAGAS